MEVPLTELMDAGVVQGSTVNGADGRNRTGVHGDARVTYMARASLNTANQPPERCAAE